MTLPRDLQLQDVGGQTYLCSPVAAEVAQAFHPLSYGAQDENNHLELSSWVKAAQSGFRLNILADARSSWYVQLQNDDGQQWRLSFEPEKALYEVDRSQSQSKSVTPEFAVAHRAPRLSHSETCEVALYVDTISMETIADQGLTSITSLVFPDSPWTAVFVQGNLTVSFSVL
jgi:sucrose-6-phosphate hydrolase SacC (GH32 family)